MAKPDKRKFRSVKRKKRRCFHGRRPAELNKEGDDLTSTSDPVPSCSTSQALAGDEKQEKVPLSASTPVKENVSVRKLQNSSFEKFESEQGVITRERAKNVGLGLSSLQVEHASGYKLQDAVLLNECISTSAICSACRSGSSKLQLFQRNNEREGLAESLFLKCSSCETETPLKTSQRLGGKGGGAHEVNRRSVLSSHQFGLAGLSQFCAGMNLPPPVTKKAYNQHLIQIKKAAVKNAENLMQESARRLIHKVATERPRDIAEIDEQTVANVSVTVDGTWQKRGHSSKIGVVFVISIDTGEILDYSVKSLVCHECKAHNDMNKESDEYKTWKQSHAPSCEINHHGSSEEMEAVAAAEIFGRSIEKRQLKYTTFVGDGDSSSFGRVRDAMEKKYGRDYVVQKEECVGHVQKRLGTALRKYKNNMKGQKLSDGKGVKGRGRLTGNMMDKMQNYYGKAIRENKGNLQGMKDGTKAVQHHMIASESEPLEKQHQYCPKDKNSWCKFWKDKLNGTSTYDESKRLPAVFMEELDPIFTRLSSDDLLSRCLKGMTQNQNEAVNGQLWSKCSKTKFCGAKRVCIAVCETVAVFNTGAASKAVTMVMCGVSPGANTMRALRLQDKTRIKSTTQKITSKYRKQQQNLRAKRKSKGDEASYQPGGFSLSSHPDKSEPKKRKGTKRSTEELHSEPAVVEKAEVRFVQPEFEVIAPKRVRTE